MKGRNPILLIAAFCGNMLGLPAVIAYSFGIYMSLFSADFGWSRGEISVAISLFNTVILLGSMLVGRLADRLPPNRLAAASMLAFGLSLVLLPVTITDVSSLWIAYAFVSILGLGTIPVVILKPITSAYAARQGTAIGLALCGTGVGAMLIPLYVTALVDWGGWKFGYWGLGAAAITAAPLLYFGLAIQTPAQPAHQTVNPDIVTRASMLRQVCTTREFWVLSLITVLSIFSIGGVVAHLFPLLRDGGHQMAAAASMASALGFASIVGRLGTGIALDKFPARLIGFVLFASGALGMLMLGSSNTLAVLAAIMLIGLVLGAEVDLAAYLTARYFGKKNNGIIFGWIYGLMAFSSIVSPLTIGLLYDTMNSYEYALNILIFPLIISAFLSIFLRPYNKVQYSE